MEEEGLCLYDALLGSPESGAFNPPEIDGLIPEPDREWVGLL
jgi:hypothetical protein